MICPSCKMEIPDGSTICPYCGFKISGNKMESYERCPFCKHLIPKGSIRCPFCGKIIRERVSGYNNNLTSRPYEYAGFWIRLGAGLIDLVLAITSFAFLLLLYRFLGGQVLLREDLDGFIGYIVIISYYTFFLSVFSSTPGKMLYGLEVEDANTHKKIKFSKASERSISYIISSFLGLGFLWIAIDRKKHQGWHDKIAKTLVIKKKKRSLILPVVLSVISLIILFKIGSLASEKGYVDFSYLGKEGDIINSIQQRLYQQSPGSCCDIMPSSRINHYSADIPLELPSRKVQSAEQIFANFSKAVIIIGGNTKSGGFGFGSGFLISPSGLFVTNYHVIKDEDKLSVALVGERSPQLFDVHSIVAEDPLRDIAVLKINGQNLPYVIMGNSDLVNVGQSVFALGSPQGLVNTISGGIISQIRETERGFKYFQITNPISEGSSGGALFNKNGEVIGITYAFYKAGQNLNLAIPINEVKDLLGLNYK